MSGVLNAHSLQGRLVQSHQRSAGNLVLQKVLTVQIEVLVAMTLQPLHYIVIVPEKDRLGSLRLIAGVRVDVLLVHFAGREKGTFDRRQPA